MLIEGGGTKHAMVFAGRSDQNVALAWLFKRRGWWKSG